MCNTIDKLTKAQIFPDNISSTIYFLKYTKIVAECERHDDARNSGDVRPGPICSVYPNPCVCILLAYLTLINLKENIREGAKGYYSFII